MRNRICNICLASAAALTLMISAAGCVNRTQVTDFALTEAARLPSTLVGQLILQLANSLLGGLQLFVKQ